MTETDRLKWKITKLNSIISSLESENKKLKKGLRVIGCYTYTHTTLKKHQSTNSTRS